ncbi:hypothetical protein, partial [Burkholderia thailandensis]|uniref:hypothetical protein n=1 Tax=Burkholderia thailandensis TaxID=57975 RepID=UPI00217E952F
VLLIVLLSLFGWIALSDYARAARPSSSLRFRRNSARTQSDSPTQPTSDTSTIRATHRASNTVASIRSQYRPAIALQLTMSSWPSMS